MSVTEYHRKVAEKLILAWEEIDAESHEIGQIQQDYRVAVDHQINKVAAILAESFPLDMAARTREGAMTPNSESAIYFHPHMSGHVRRMRRKRTSHRRLGLRSL